MSTTAFPRIVPASDHALLVVFGAVPGPAVRESVRRFMSAFAAATRDALPPRAPQRATLRDAPVHPTPVRNLHPGYVSVLVSFDLAEWSLDAAREFVSSVLARSPQAEAESPRLVVIPVCYEGDCAPDLAALAAQHGMQPQEAVHLHTEAEYIVEFLGFSPGFPYLTGLDPRLETPRLATPRALVPAGSVAIGGAQTGIYPVASPGGWHLIGRTPLALFDSNTWPPAKLRMGDRLRFEPIPAARFATMTAGAWTLDEAGGLRDGSR